MLTELSIQDFAIIDAVSITFSDGLTVLTGETGAGKSIIIDAVQLLAGGRGSSDFVRHNTKKAEIEGLFTIDEENHAIYAVATEFGIDIQDGMVVLKRTITKNGKSICRVNGKLVTLAILREFGKTLIDIHTQHETQSLMDVESHVELLDLFCGEKVSKTKQEYLHAYEEMLTVKKRYQQLSENEQETVHRIDLLTFQKKELEEAELEPNEEVALIEERNKLQNFAQIYGGIQDAYNAMFGEQKGLEWLNIAQTALQDNKEYDPFILEKAEELSNHYYMMEELAFTLRNHLDTLQYDSGRLNEVEARLNEVDQLKRKYGSTVNEMIDYLGKIDEELEQLQHKDSHLLKLEEQIKGLKQDAYLEARQLHDLREAGAKSLTKAIHKELKGLYLDKATFEIVLGGKNKESDLHKNGFDHVMFYISTNAGEPLKPIHKVASGGELSRIMLALKKIFAKHQGITSVIFDEVDTGVSGRVAQRMAEVIAQISRRSQVLCISHLPQVAAMADCHKYINKKVEKERTHTIVHELTDKEKVDELSRMITGTKLTDTAREHAKELLGLATAFKQTEIKVH